MPEQTVVCVLGMHRSGTSLLTRLLNQLGVELGPEEHLMPPTAANPKGYWEHQLITDLDDEVLARLGGSWHEPPAISTEMFARPELADLRRRARALVASEFGDAPLWGWKDPRTCLVLPFWQHVIPPMRYVVCLRDPLDVARSLVRAEVDHHVTDGHRAARLWLRYTHDALAYTLGHPRILVFYEDVLADWRGELARLAAFVGVEDRLASAERAVEADETVDPSLARYRHEVWETVDDPRLGFPVKALHLALRLVRDVGPGSADLLPHGTLETFAAAALEAGDPTEGGRLAPLLPDPDVFRPGALADQPRAAAKARALRPESGNGG